jgi:1,4-alpha-glucan branching enzyme
VPGAGVWSLFVESVSTGNLYKFEVLGSDGVWRTKADPMARFAEAAPHTASIVYESQYAWDDDQWMWYRGQRQLYKEPISVYEVHLGSWRKGLTYLELANQLVEYVSWQGYTHVEFLPVAQHPFEGSWGYHVTGYFAPMSKFGSRTSSAISSTPCTRPGSASSSTGCRATSHRPRALQRFDGTAQTSMRIPAWAGTRLGSSSSTSAATR